MKGNKKKVEKIIEAIVISKGMQESNISTIEIIVEIEKFLGNVKFTEKQKSVLELLGKGLNETQIAAEMKIVYQGVQKHKDRITNKVMKHLDTMGVFF